MVEVLTAYQQAGIVLLFTEETGLSIQDQINTAWNTYHPAFRYVHEKSGQRLRPATLQPLVPGHPPDPMLAAVAVHVAPMPARERARDRRPVRVASACRGTTGGRGAQQRPLRCAVGVHVDTLVADVERAPDGVADRKAAG